MKCPLLGCVGAELLKPLSLRLLDGSVTFLTALELILQWDRDKVIHSEDPGEKTQLTVARKVFSPHLAVYNLCTIRGIPNSPQSGRKTLGLREAA